MRQRDAPYGIPGRTAARRHAGDTLRLRGYQRPVRAFGEKDSCTAGGRPRSSENTRPVVPLMVPALVAPLIT